MARASVEIARIADLQVGDRVRNRATDQAHVVIANDGVRVAVAARVAIIEDVKDWERIAQPRKRKASKPKADVSRNSD